jgi:hypothetical protein
MHSTPRDLTVQTTAPPSRDCRKGSKQRQQKPLIIYGTLGLDINNTLEKRNHDACEIAQYKTGVTS